VLRALFAAVLIVHTAACGTIMYPERKGQQKTDKIDSRVAILDGVALLFFILPGVVAFAVDFGNRSIYLPEGQKDLLDRGNKR